LPDGGGGQFSQKEGKLLWEGSPAERFRVKGERLRKRKKGGLVTSTVRKYGGRKKGKTTSPKRETLKVDKKGRGNFFQKRISPTVGRGKGIDLKGRSQTKRKEKHGANGGKARPRQCINGKGGGLG